MTEFLTGLFFLAACGAGYLLWSHGKLVGIVQTLEKYVHKPVVPTVASLDLKPGAAVDQLPPS